MGCVSSTFLEDDDCRIIGVNASHIVSLTSSTYGILTTIGANAADDTKSPPHQHPNHPSPPPPPPPPLSLSSTTPSRSRSRSKPPPDAHPQQPEAEVINSWELMAGLLDPSTPAKSKSPRTNSNSTSSCRDKDRPPRCIRFPLRPIDGNASSTRLPPRPHPTTDAGAFERRCPPGGAHCAVLYTTTLRGVRPTFEACNAVRAALQSHGVAFRERDVSMDRGFREELRGLLGGGGIVQVGVPRLFVRGRDVGGAEEVARLDEEGALGTLLEGLPRARGGCCDGCGGMRFLPCFECCGSRKVVVGGVEGRRKGKGPKGVVLRCGDCNENGLVLCPICS